MLQAFALLLLQASEPAAAGDPLKDVKDKDPLVRMTAIAGLEARGAEDKKALQALTSALKDDDWEVAETAVNALARLRAPATARDLANFAAEAPVRRLRAAAARALAAINDPKAVDALAGAATSKKTGPGALQALAAYALAAEQPLPAGEIARELRDKDPEVRAAAAAAIALVPENERGEFLSAALADEDMRVACAVLDALTARGDPTLLPLLAETMSAPRTNDVVARRLVRATAACASDPAAARDLANGPATAALTGADAGVARRWAEWCGLAGDVAWTPLMKGSTAASEDVRAASLHALRAWATHADAKTALLAAAQKDASARVRRAALASLVAARGASDADVRAALVERLAKDADLDVRLKAAVALGAPKLEGADAALLAAARGDADWRVMVSAAVSLGRTRAPAARAALIELTGVADWRMRGAAAMGLLYLYDKEAVPALIPLLEDPEPRVARTAHEILIRITFQKFERKIAPYSEWWEKTKNVVRVLTPEEAAERGKEYAFSSSRAKSFTDLDVIVFQSRGDAIESLLERIGIGHRRTSAGKVASAELHPFAIYVSNCTGEIESSDLEALQWHVLVGGYFFGSCWSLGHTVEKMHPGVLRMYPGHEEGTILDRVEARACVPGSPYLEGVFPHETVPVYDLQGAHLIEVLQPERCEVLVDSPGCATRWGCGNLAAWFELGHGLVLDSANHFQEQGIVNAPNLKKPEERMVYAFDHMALEYSAWRAAREEKWWKSTRETAQHVFDESAFRFITNFVRQKRQRDL